MAEEAALAPETVSEAFEQVVRGRRSVRKFLEEPVPEPVIEKCLELAVLAPNSSNLQPWEFHWVRTPQMKAVIAEACMGQSAATTASDLIVVVARTGTWRAHAKRMIADWPGGNPPKIVRDYYGRLAPFMYTQGILSVIGHGKRVLTMAVGLFRAMPREPVSLGDMKVWATKSTALACENIMLAARAYGYDTCPMEGFDSARVKRALKLPGDALIPMIISVGKAAPDGIYGPQFRFSTNEFVKRY
ncbi:MAG: nitroreductase family protein [Candidatus Hydrogenedentes bacterium]|nr:nitroreductase family protein [Candidatus Hydrogenedentota bacterium]